MNQKLIIASGNAHKVEEFGGLLDGLGFEVHSAAVCGGMPDVEENGDSFAANALIKARALRAIAPTDAWILSDDSGLSVDAIAGAPGIYSARYAGCHASDAENVKKLMHVLCGIPYASRTARFRCVLALIDPEGQHSTHEGACEGHIAMELSGSTGFGYDPIFIPEGYSETFAALGDTIKAELSHRAKAVDVLRDFLQKRLPA